MFFGCIAMSTFKKYKKIKSVLSEFPGVKSYKEFDILIEIGYHQEQGCPLTMKQLMLLEVASQATVRRYLGHLVEDGLVKKIVLVNDHRSVVLKLTNSTIKVLANHLLKILEHLRAMHDEVPAKLKSKKKKT